MMTVNQSFGAALKRIRQAKNMSQEDFSDVSSRTYISSLERGLKSPTIEKVTSLAEAMDIEPLTLLFLTYADIEGEPVEAVLSSLRRELSQLKIN